MGGCILRLNGRLSEKEGKEEEEEERISCVFAAF